MHLRRCLSAKGLAVPVPQDMANALVDALVEASMPGRPASAHLAIVDKLLQMQGVDWSASRGACRSAQNPFVQSLCC